MPLAARVLDGSLPPGWLNHVCISLLRHHTYLLVPDLFAVKGMVLSFGSGWPCSCTPGPLGDASAPPPAGGSFEMDSSVEEQDPWGSTAPAFGMPQAPARGGVPSQGRPTAMSGGSQGGTPGQPARTASLPGGTPAHQAPEEAGFGSPGMTEIG